LALERLSTGVEPLQLELATLNQRRSDSCADEIAIWHDGSVQEKHGFQELDSLKAADYSSQTALALSRGNGQRCGDEQRSGRLFDHGSPLHRQDQPIESLGTRRFSRITQRSGLWGGEARMYQGC
jgi:hypothetical protein